MFKKYKTNMSVDSCKEVKYRIIYQGNIPSSLFSTRDKCQHCENETDKLYPVCLQITSNNSRTDLGVYLCMTCGEHSNWDNLARKLKIFKNDIIPDL